MNVFIMTDMEGVSLLGDTEKLDDTDTLVRLMCDTNAAIEGCIRAGADNVYVVDGHGSGNNFISGLLDSRAVQLKGEWQDYIRSGKIDCYLEIGAHAMAGTINAFYDHTQSSETYHDYMLNGILAGEIAQGAAYVGEYDIPFIMVSGDRAACEEARALIDGVYTAEVKSAGCRRYADCIDGDTALKLITDTVCEAVGNYRGISPVKVTYPLTVTLELNRSDHCDNIVSACKDEPGFKRLDARTVQRKLDRIKYYQDILF